MATAKIRKSLTLGFAALSIAALAVTSSLLCPVSAPAQEAYAADGQPSDGKKMDGAKGLFFEQLEKPSESLNTGLRYWIEMKRDGVTQRVSNKMQFKSGDSIRFHVRSNINGYAYILLSSGSRGEQSVLFPDEKAGESNKLDRTREYVLPQDGYLTFDENPGTEKLTLLLSRTPIDAQAYLAKPSGTKEVTLIASAQTGSKDLVPARIYVAFNAPRSDEAPPPAVIAAANRHADKPAAVPAKIEKSVKTAKKVEKKVMKTASAAPHTAVAAVPARGSKPVRASDSEASTTTIVSENAKGILHVDVDLDHI
ncbi:MAG: DUF4384 domain-containing protein [Cyanobacteria bacterium REEB67]|nr:DUF4384 domain-containing protein [Cyanobacteria bacterium REEB67]